MAIEKTLNTRIKLRIDTHEAWMLNDPVLLDGEIAIATLGTAVAGAIDNVPSVSMKVGQQNKKYSELDFMYARAADVLVACKTEDGLKSFVNNVIKDAGLATDATIVEINADIDALEKALGALTTRVETAEGKITALETESAKHALKTELEAVDAKFADYTKTADLPKDLGDFTNNAGYAKTADVNTELGKKADKTQVAADIASAITASENKEDAKFANYRKAADQDAIDATFATKTELANEKKALQDEIDADVKVVADDLAGYKTTNAAALELKADKTQVATDIANAIAPLATTEALNGVDAKFANYNTKEAQKAIDDAQDVEIGKKVDKVEGKDLIATSEIERLAGVHNYDDAEVRGLIGDNTNAINTLAGKVGTVPEGQTVMGIITNIQENAYDDTELRGLIKDNSDAIDEIEKDYLKAADIENFETKANVKKVADDLAAYVTSNDAALAGVKATAEAARTEEEVNSQIDAKITALDLANTYEPKGAEQNAKNYVDQKFEDADLGQYTTEQEVKDIVDGVIAGAVDGDTITGLANLVEYLNTHGTEAKEMGAAIDVLEGKVETIEGKPAYGITATQVSNWDGEVGAKALAETKLDASTFTEYSNAHTNDYTNKQIDDAIDADVKAAIDAEVLRANGAYDAAGAAATAKSEAIADAAGKYETIGTAQGIVDGLKLSETYEPKGAEQNAKDYVDQKFTDANLDQYTTEAEVKTQVEAYGYALDSRVTEVDNKFADYTKTDDLDTTLGLTTKLADKADKSVVDAMYTNAKIDELVAGAKSGAESTAASALATARTEISAEIDADVKVVADDLAEYVEANDAALAGVKATADSAVQSVSASDGLKATREGNAVTIAFDDACTFIFDCGTSK